MMNVPTDVSKMYLELNGITLTLNVRIEAGIKLVPDRSVLKY